MSTDSDIIRRARETPRAFGELFDRYSSRILGFAIRRVGSDAADDVVSETFLAAYRKLDRFDLSSESALPWLFGIAVRVVHRHRSAEAVHWRAMVAARGTSHAAADETEAIDRRTDALRAAQDLAPLIAKLPQRDRDTLLLYAWGEMTYEEVAVALRVPVGTVRSRLNRVRRRLADQRPNQITDAVKAGHQS